MPAPRWRALRPQTVQRQRGSIWISGQPSRYRDRRRLRPPEQGRQWPRREQLR